MLAVPKFKTSNNDCASLVYFNGAYAAASMSELLRLKQSKLFAHSLNESFSLLHCNLFDYEC